MRVVRHSIGILTFCAAFMLAGLGAPTVHAAQYSAIVLDMRDGRVLHESNADRRQSPASLTKMMTLYLAFEAVQNGQLRLDQKVRVSRHASRQPPSKLYLKAGQRVTIRSLIRASAIKSANDAAVALGEAIAGSEKAFARLMTTRARQLGMTRTTFKNANGLTAKGHLSTARDMALLGRHLFFDFPQYYNLFSRKSDRAAGKRVYTTNRLLSSYRGADGIKTGYTRAAGYNLVASARRGQKRIIAALFGGKSSRWRNARMKKLLDKGFVRASTRVALVPPNFRRAAVARAPLPPAKPGTPATALQMLAQTLGTQAVAAAPVSTSPLAPLYAVIPPMRPTPTTAGIEPAGKSAEMPIPSPRPGNAALGSPTDSEMLAEAASVLDNFEIRGRLGELAYRPRFIGLEPAYAARACQTLRSGEADCRMPAQGA